MAVSHTNNSIAASVVATLSTMESFPSVVRTITRDEAVTAWALRTKQYTSLANHTWFLSNGIAYRCTKSRCQIMSFYNN